ncbi:MAG: DUF4340 domain-containing protein [Lentisphaerae bacterium]|jgi:hypothetical protein|nr:DUF4340 domain-containing protein [Lentisphaerota bacterium]
MPSFRTTLVLLAACLGCGMLLWVLNRSDLRAGRPASGAPGSLFPAPLRETDYLMIERNGYRAELQRGADGWMITHPLSAYASQTAVQRLLDSLERAPLRARIEAHELALRELTLADFGLLKPQARLVVAGPRARAELMLGQLTGTSNELFAGFMNSGDVLLTDPALLAALPASPFALSDSSLFRGERRRINAIGLRRSGQPYLKLAREPGGWMITQPLAARADETAVAALLDALEEARIARFVWPAPDRPDDAGASRPSQLSRFGLAEESEQGVQLQLWMTGDPVGRRIRLGTPVESLPGHVHALAEDGPAVVAVTNTLDAMARQPLAALRDKRILVFAPDALDLVTVQGMEPPLALRRGAEDDWELTSPVAGPAESGQVALLLEALLALRAAGFEPADPAAAATAGALQVDLAGRATAWRLVRAGGSGGVEATVRIGLTNETTAYQVPTSQWARVDALLRCPATFRSRTLVRLPAEGIRRLAVKRADGTQEAVEREGNAGAGWRSSAPDRAINRVALDNWLQQLAHLRAARIASLGTDAGADPRGFDAPQVEVTIDLTAQDRLRRILIVGGPAPGEGRLAMVKGDDTVFVLDAETCLLLEQSFLLPVEPRVPDIDTTRPPQPETL